MTAKRVADNHGTDNLILLFADTLVEGPDLYQFIKDAAENVGGKLVTVKDGRTPFQVFHDDRFLGNSRLANCSKYLKQKPCREWIEAACTPDEAVLYVGIDWSEIHRLPAIEAGWSPYKIEAPLCERPYLSKEQMLEALNAEGIETPAAYKAGFPHNNCMDQGCVRGGQAYWRHILRTRPGVYTRTEREEQELRDYLGKDVTILTQRKADGSKVPITLREFRESAHPELFDAQEWGGCGCFTDEGGPPDESYDDGSGS